MKKKSLFITLRVNESSNLSFPVDYSYLQVDLWVFSEVKKNTEIFSLLSFYSLICHQYGLHWFQIILKNPCIDPWYCFWGSIQVPFYHFQSIILTLTVPFINIKFKKYSVFGHFTLWFPAYCPQRCSRNPCLLFYGWMQVSIYHLQLIICTYRSIYKCLM